MITLEIITYQIFSFPLLVKNGLIAVSFVVAARVEKTCALVMIDEIRSNEEDQLVDPESKWFFRYVFGICIWRERLYHSPPPFLPYLAIRHLFTCCVTFQITQKVVQSRHYAVIIEITKLIYTVAIKSLLTDYLFVPTNWKWNWEW